MQLIDLRDELSLSQGWKKLVNVKMQTNAGLFSLVKSS